MERKQFRLDDQARDDIAVICRYYALRSDSVAVRLALRELARRLAEPPAPPREVVYRGGKNEPH